MGPDNRAMKKTTPFFRIARVLNGYVLNGTPFLEPFFAATSYKKMSGKKSSLGAERIFFRL
jgi:hypothetical protein